MNFKRWLPTFLAFPIGGLLAIETAGSLHDPVSAAAGGLVAGAVIGAGQWLALRSAGIGRRWVGYTAAGWSLGWVPTWLVIVDIDRGHHVFGSSGALLMTVVTGLALRRIAGAAGAPSAFRPAPAGAKAV